MTDDEILEIRDSLLPGQGERFDMLAFGRAVAAAEREACAKAVELEAVNAEETGEEGDMAYNLALEHAIGAIRLRSKP